MFGKAVRLARIENIRMQGIRVFSILLKKGVGISMDKKSVIRFASLMTAVLISASSLPRLCATVSAEQATDSVTAAAGELHWFPIKHMRRIWPNAKTPKKA